MIRRWLSTGLISICLVAGLGSAGCADLSGLLGALDASDVVAGTGVVAGPQGETGEKGDPGIAGTAGPAGAAGPIGATGATGADGATGANGANGADGADGATGPQGPAGTAGAEPSGIYISTQSATPPTGYTYTGLHFETPDLVNGVAPLPESLRQHTATAIGGRIYVAGGYAANPSDALRIYDPTTNTWTSGASMPSLRYVHAATEAGGLLYVIGGSNNSAWLSSVDVYDPTTNSWSSGPALPAARYRSAAATFNGVPYVFGGGDGSNLRAECYKLVGGTWTAIASMPAARYNAAAAVVNGRICVFGGSGNSGGMTNVWTYDPATDAWDTSSTAGMFGGRTEFAGVAYDGGLAAVGGYISAGMGSSGNGTVEYYVPAANAWQSRPSLPVGVYYHAAASLGDKIYVVGGYASNTQVNTVYTLQRGKQLFLHVKN